MTKTLEAASIFIAAAVTAACVSTTGNSGLGTAETTFPINNPAPEGTLELLDGFEEENFWQAMDGAKGGGYSIDTDTTEEWSTEGDFCAQWSFAKIPEGAEAAFTTENPAQKDWTHAKALTADINNTCQNPLAVAIETQGGPCHIASRTQEVLIGIGENINVYFDLLHGITDISGNSVSGLTEKDDIRSISFLIKGKSFSGSILVDNINLVY